MKLKFMPVGLKEEERFCKEFTGWKDLSFESCVLLAREID